MDVADIFSMFDDIFGGAFGGGRRAGARGGGGGVVPQRGFDLETQVELTLEEVAAGAEKTIEFERQDECENCKGTGAKPGTSPVVCPQCGGQGRVAQQGFGGMFRMVTTCPSCRGTSSVVKEHCPTCRGTGRQMKKRVVKSPSRRASTKARPFAWAARVSPARPADPTATCTVTSPSAAHPLLAPQQRPGLPDPHFLHPGLTRRQDHRADAERQGRDGNPGRTRTGKF